MEDNTHELKAGSPKNAGLDSNILQRATDLLQSEIEARRITAASLLVARQGTVALSQGFGHLTPDEKSSPVEPDSIFLLASITKPVTACALMLLVDRGQVSLNDPVSLYIPEFQGGNRGQILVRHLLSHTSGLPDMLPQNIAFRRAHAPLSEFVQGAIQTPLRYVPNTDFAYQSKGILLAAEIVERISGEPLRDFEARELFTPLAMNRSALGLGSFQISETVWCGTTLEETKDQQRFGANSPYWRDQGHPWGGMHSTAPDLAILLQTMLNRGIYNNKRLFSHACVDAMISNQNPHLPAPWGLGWALGCSIVWSYFGDLVSPSTFGHTGATGTVAWADPKRQLICVILTNQMVDSGSLLRRVSNLVSVSVQ